MGEVLSYGSKQMEIVTLVEVSKGESKTNLFYLFKLQLHLWSTTWLFWIILGMGGSIRMYEGVIVASYLA